MTNEEWVKKWLQSSTGRAFAEGHPDYWKTLWDNLSSGVLIEVDPAEGLAGECTCGKVKGMGRDVRFLLGEYEFMSICPGCDSWQIFRTRKGEQKFGRA